MTSMHPIAPDLISVVIQGPLYRGHWPGRGIEACLTSVRQYLPGAEVIVSTWPGAEIDGLVVDRVIQSPDPGGIRDVSGNLLNLNRQLVSTLAGIKCATRPYVMKLRADLNLTSPMFACAGEYTDDMPSCASQRLFRAPVTISTLFIRDPVWFPMLYHISDLAHFGLRDDLLAFWDQPIFHPEVLCHSRPRRNPFGNYQGFSLAKMNAEQALMTGFLRKHGLLIHLDHPCQVRTHDLNHWETILSHNFRVLDYKDAGIDFPEHLIHSIISPQTIFSAHAIAKAATRTPMQRRWRRIRVWLNQYVLCYGQLVWWVPAVSIMLFSISPALARRVRNAWRKVRGNRRSLPDETKVDNGAQRH